MFVAKRMTANPTTIHPNTTIADASEIMRTKKFRRLPVVDDSGKLLGIVTDRDLREVSPSPATTLSIFELNYLLAKMQVKDIMKRNVVTIGTDATIEEAALLMYNHKIGGLVVVGQDGRVAGIITETDIFKCFVDVMGLTEGKTRLTLVVPDHVGVLHDITGVFKKHGVSIGSLALHPGGDGEKELVIRADIADAKALLRDLAAAGYPVQHSVQIG
ncbi:MAG: CBS and ACT domain-containing protein [Negativicutes bacterium]|nr:CBS and ACT domain-containing protein [Negativicutes bacterium]